MKYIVGIDEVGRGPLAGPVTVCVTLCEEKIYKKLKLNKNLPPIGKDSKKLKEKDREKFSKVLEDLKKQGKISFSINHVSNTIIDTRGISFAIKKAIHLGMKKLKINPKNYRILLDGGLKVPVEFEQKTIIKGDEKERIIAWASILAKVSRDRLMVKMAEKYPKYDFGQHKGYGTAKHSNAIYKYGLTLVHRVTFCRKY
ncbi:MAG: ribonuclease HII [Parcubacteria group bacterium Gr01-1014_46]|nr:MAG: ribonuclease HII [Parcubacteria group bacterium Gr01-1014_46]